MLYIGGASGLETLWPETLWLETLAHRVTFGDFMDGNFMAGDFLTRIPMVHVRNIFNKSYMYLYLLCITLHYQSSN